MDDHDHNMVETSDQKRNKSMTSDRYQSTRINKNMDHIRKHSPGEKIEFVEDVTGKSTSKNNVNNTKTSELKSRSENQQVLHPKKTSGDTSEVESWVQTSNMDTSSLHADEECLCWKKDAVTQMPRGVQKKVSRDLSQDAMSSQGTQQCDCGSSKEKKTSSNIGNYYAAKHAAGVQKYLEEPSHMCDCTSEDDKEVEEKISLQSEMCSCGCAKDFTEDKKRKGPRKIAKVEERSFNEDALLKSK